MVIEGGFGGGYGGYGYYGWGKRKRRSINEHGSRESYERLRSPLLRKMWKLGRENANKLGKVPVVAENIMIEKFDPQEYDAYDDELPKLDYEKDEPEYEDENEAIYEDDATDELEDENFIQVDKTVHSQHDVGVRSRKRKKRSHSYSYYSYGSYGYGSYYYPWYRGGSSNNLNPVEVVTNCDDFGNENFTGLWEVRSTRLNVDTL